MSQFIDIHTHNVKEGYAIVFYRFGVDKVEVSKRFCVAVHPWDSVTCGEKLGDLRDFIVSHSVCGVGEIGLDFSAAKTLSDRAIQRAVFIEQVKLANELNLPIFIHSVKSNSEVCSILKRYNRTSDVIVHGFIGSKKECDDFLKAGCFLSFSLSSLSSPKTVEAFKSVSLDKVFCETDNSIIEIERVYTEFAKLKGCELEDLKSEIEINYRKVFKNE